MDYCLTTSGLTKQYRNETCVRSVNLAVPQGCVYGFLGPNGAGKTTTMKMLLGLVRPTSGKIQVLGQELNEKNRLSILRSVGSLIESPSYYGHLSASENLEIICSLRSLPKREIGSALSLVRLPKESKKPVSKFSLGMKQRLGIAAALLGSPRLLLLDEPTNGLDPAGIQEMRELVKALPDRYGMTVLIASHLLAEIDQIANYVGIIRQGELVFQESLPTLHAKSNKHLALRTTNNVQAAQLISPCRQDGDWLTLPLLSDPDAAKVSLVLAKHEVGILRMEQRETSLEDIFLSMTAISGREAAL